MLPRCVRNLCVRILVLMGPAVCLAHGARRPHATVQSAPTLILDDVGKGTALLDGPWQFHLGDNPAWAAPGFDDSQWEALRADKPWGAQGHPDYTGFAWYRRHIELSPARGVSPDFALLVPSIDDAYELYWNGVPVGHFGTLPPHAVWYPSAPAQTFGLGKVTSGVLAIRVWKAPLLTTDSGIEGGFEASPMIGSPAAIATHKAALDFDWLRKQQFRFGLSSLYALVALLSLFAWWRDRRQWLLFWMAVLSFTLVSELFLDGLRLHYTASVQGCLSQIEIAIREMSLWFLLLWLLQLQSNRKLVVLTRKAALFSVLASVLDGLLLLLYPAHIGGLVLQGANAALEPVIIFFELLPAMLVAYAFVQGKALDSARWVVAAVAFCNGMTYFVQNLASQGARFTHWQLGQEMMQPLLSVAGNPINIHEFFRMLLFFSIVYAVIRYSIESRRRTVALEREFQNARELQQVLVPESLPIVPGFTLTSAYRPAQEVGGDFFQIIALDNDATLVVLGDVSGKGLRAAMAVSLIIGAVRALAEDHSSPAQLLTQLNRRLCGHLQGGFATCVVVRLNTDDRCLISSAGHPAPYLNNRELNLPGALPLGVSPLATYEESTIRIKVGDHFALYTDGLLEARNPTGELYSFARLETLFATRPSAAQATQAAVNFGQDDDITVLTLTRLAQGEEAFARHLVPTL